MSARRREGGWGKEGGGERPESGGSEHRRLRPSFHIASLRSLRAQLLRFLHHLPFPQLSINMAPSIEGKRPEVKSPMSTTCCNREEITPRYRVTVVGSGNWGSVAAKLIASNTVKLPIFHGESLLPMRSPA
ncbi:hypothetical protein BHM03_00004176 [Ensete ventricosum]|nr:hypothetical protein BHM03_00004176 [Ensete ventricosum]